MAPRRVFVTNFAGHDFAAAKPYGEIYWITKGYVSFQSLDRVKFLITEQVLLSDSEDWLLLSGTPLISVIAALVWYAIHKKVKLLVFDKKDDGKYRELIISEANIGDLLKVIPEGIVSEAKVANG
jgi:hypothetical protein